LCYVFFFVAGMAFNRWRDGVTDMEPVCVCVRDMDYGYVGEGDGGFQQHCILPTYVMVYFMGSLGDDG